MPIHPTAIIDSAARINQTVTIGPYVHIQGPVEIGAHCSIAGHCHFLGPTIIGAHNEFHSACIVGDVPQDKKYKEGEGGVLKVGEHNIFREGCVLHHSTTSKNTIIGNNNFFMIYSHFAHDCKVGDHNITGCYSVTGGHSEIGNYVNLSAYVAIHPHCRVGSHAYVGGGAIVIQDIPPYVMLGRSNKDLLGINVKGLQRLGFKPTTIQVLRRAYKIFYRQGLPKNEAIEKLKPLVAEAPELGIFIDFLEQKSIRGVVRY